MVTNNLPKVAERLPAAMLYYFLKYPVERGKTLSEAQNNVDKELKMSGYLLDDAKVLLEIDKTLESLPVKLTKDGTINGSFKKNVKSAELFKALMKHAEDCLKKTGKEILDGNIAAEPFKTARNDACKYCAYSAVCRLDKKFNVISKPTLDDNEIIERITKNN